MKRAALGLAVLAACHARVGGEGDPDAGGDGGRIDDAVIDAAPDALPCTGGDAHAQDGGACYEVFLATASTWAEARAACQVRGGDLARIDSLAENNIITPLVGLIDGAWLGGSDVATEMQWVWPDGGGLTYNKWRTGEPNNGNGNFQEDCMILEGDNDGTWDDRPCAPDPLAGVPGEYPYVCER